MSDTGGGNAIFGHIPDEDNPAANLVRSKLESIYANEPAAIEEEREIAASGAHSKHQAFIADLMKSGKDMASVQTAWHEYYQALDDDEKHIVWQEFYQQSSRQTASMPETNAPNQKHTLPALTELSELNDEKRSRTIADLHKKLIATVTANGQLKAKHHIRSVAFSLGMASLVTGLLFFVTNNERFIAPFIQPTKSIAAAPLITDGSPVGPETKLIIPKINLEAPIVDEVSESTERVFQDALENGIVHYPGTPWPGENGNAVMFGHSSANLFNPGKHKYVFVRLHQIEVGDTYAINYGGVQYVYRVIIREVVKPTQVDVLYRQPEGKPAVTTLITCDPPGTSNNRLIIVGEQISPAVGENKQVTAPAEPVQEATEIPSNAPSLLSRLLGLN